MRVACTRQTKGRSPHIPPASSRRHTRFNFEAISCSYLSPLISTEMIFWALVFVFVSTCSAADTQADWPDADEENALKKDIAIDQLTIDNYSRFHSQDRKWVKPGVSPAVEFRIHESPVSSEDLAIPDDGLTYQRGKRDAEEEEDGSGENPCHDDTPPCRGDGQECVFNTSLPNNYYCKCKPGFEEVTAAPHLTCTAVSAQNLPLVVGLSVGIPLSGIIAVMTVFLVCLLVRRRKANSRKAVSDNNQSNISSIFSRLPMFGMLRNQGMYQPHNFSETSEEDINYDRYKRYNNDRSYSENSSWTSRTMNESRGLDTEQPTSLSWERFCLTSVPKEEFHIKRPQIFISANPTFQI